MARTRVRGHTRKDGTRVKPHVRKTNASSQPTVRNGQITFQTPSQLVRYMKSHRNVSLDFLNGEEWLQYLPKKKRWLMGVKDTTTPAVFETDDELFTYGLSRYMDSFPMTFDHSVVGSSSHDSMPIPGDKVRYQRRVWKVHDWKNTGNSFRLELRARDGTKTYASQENTDLKVIS